MIRFILYKSTSNYMRKRLWVYLFDQSLNYDLDKLWAILTFAQFFRKDL